tara:strand:+ start:127 stop:273 length:147 start_codon:yes stop_codon:yes gene_type:complete
MTESFLGAPTSFLKIANSPSRSGVAFGTDIGASWEDIPKATGRFGIIK